MSSRVRRLALPIVALTIGVVALATAIYLTILPRGGSAVSVGGPFSLVTGDGRTVTDRDLRGAPYLVFFGFTHCPDICPTKLFQMSEVFRAMGANGDKVRALFITVDPERDTPELMKSYVSSFDGRIIGLTGDRAAIDKAVRDFRAYAKKVPTKDGDYTMEHTSYVYLMDRRNRFVSTLTLNRPAGEVARDVLKEL